MNQACAICGRENVSDAWFVIFNDPCLDKLTISQWDEAMSYTAELCVVCSPRHVEELVVHWMVTGSLDYPLASSTTAAPDRRKTSAAAATTNWKAPLAELVIHRESVTRTLGDNPYAFAPLLLALTSALRPQDANESSSCNPDDELCLVT